MCFVDASSSNIDIESSDLNYKNYKCLDCESKFKAVGKRIKCPTCESSRVEICDNWESINSGNKDAFKQILV